MLKNDGLLFKIESLNFTSRNLNFLSILNNKPSFFDIF